MSEKSCEKCANKDTVKCHLCQKAVMPRPSMFRPKPDPIKVFYEKWKEQKLFIGTKEWCEYYNEMEEVIERYAEEK